MTDGQSARFAWNTACDPNAYQYRRLRSLPSARTTMSTKRHVNPETGKFRSASTSKKYRRIVYSGLHCLGQKNPEKYDLPSTRSGIHHACMRCIAGIELHAYVYELASCLKGAAGSQICQSGAAMHQQRSLCLLCKTEPTPEVGGLKQALLSCFYSAL
jgi:hypothetical protein